jgi:hypothetical protein
MKNLTDTEFKDTFAAPMARVGDDEEPPFDFWGYFSEIPEKDFAGNDCSAGQVDYAWTDFCGNYQHVLINSEDRNVFMVIVLDLAAGSVHGHRLLDLNREYGLYDEGVE